MIELAKNVPDRPKLIFGHNYRDKHFILNVYINPKSQASDITEIVTRDNDGTPICIFNGKIIERSGSKEFHTVNSTNLTTVDQQGYNFTSTVTQEELAKIKTRTPRAAGATIAMLVSTGIFDEWHSSLSLQPRGRNMYERYLAFRTGIIVDEYATDDKKHYIVRKATG